MKYALILSIIFFNLCTSYHKINTAESIPTYHALLVIPKDKVTQTNEDLSKAGLGATSFEYMPKSTLTNTENNTFLVHGRLCSRPFYISLDRSLLFLLSNDKDKIIVAIESGKRNHHFYIHPETIIDSHTEYNYSVYRNKRGNQDRNKTEKHFS